jgi:hypothetical protein
MDDHNGLAERLVVTIVAGNHPRTGSLAFDRVYDLVD